MLLGRIGTPRLKMATAIVTRRELARLLANRRYCNHYYAPSFRGFRHKANTLERNSFQGQFPRAPSLLSFRHPSFALPGVEKLEIPVCGAGIGDMQRRGAGGP